jgi:hypothetical protein
MADETFLNSEGVEFTARLPPPLGRGDETNSVPAALAAEDYAALQAVTAAVDALRVLIQDSIDDATPTGGNLTGKVDHSTTGIGHGVKTVTTAGTDVALATTAAAKWVTIQAQTDNTGIIAVGASGVDATVATGTGVALAAGESMTIPCDDLADIFIDATVNGEGVRYTYGTGPVA